MNKLPLYILLSLALAACLESKIKNSDASVIEGHIKNASGNKVYFFTYPDSAALFLGYKSAIDSSEINKSGSYSFSISNNQPVIFNIEYEGKILASNLFLSPGSVTKLNFAGGNYIPEITGSDIQSKYNKFLLAFSNMFYGDTEVAHEYYIATNYMDLNQFREYNEARKQKQLNFYSDFFKNDDVDKAFHNYVLNTINYGIAVDRLMYLWKKRMKSENIFADSAFLAFETPSFIENKNAFNCPAYIRFLNLFIKDTYERMVERGELSEKKSGKLIPVVEKYRLTLSLLKEPFRKIVLYNILVDDLKENNGDRNYALTNFNTIDSMEALFRRKYSVE